MSRYVLRDFDTADEIVISRDTPVSRITRFFNCTLACPGAHAESMTWRVVDAITAPDPDLYALEPYGIELVPIP